MTCNLYPILYAVTRLYGYTLWYFKNVNSNKITLIKLFFNSVGLY